MNILSRNLDLHEVIKQYKRIAPFYDTWSKLTERKALRLALDLAKIKDGENVIEIACGTGWLFREIIKENPRGTNIGFDISPEMLESARKKLLADKVKNYALHQGDIFALNFDNERFDLVINNFMVDLLPQDKFPQVATLFFTLLKPGGRLVVSTFSFGNKPYHRFWSWLAKYLPKLLTGCRPIDFKPFLNDAGFEIISHNYISQNTFPSEVILATKHL